MSYVFPLSMYRDIIALLLYKVTIHTSQISSLQLNMPFAIVTRTYQSRPEISRFSEFQLCYDTFL